MRRSVNGVLIREVLLDLPVEDVGGGRGREPDIDLGRRAVRDDVDARPARERADVDRDRAELRMRDAALEPLEAAQDAHHLRDGVLSEVRHRAMGGLPPGLDGEVEDPLLGVGDLEAGQVRRRRWPSPGA